MTYAVSFDWLTQHFTRTIIHKITPLYLFFNLRLQHWVSLVEQSYPPLFCLRMELSLVDSSSSVPSDLPLRMKCLVLRAYPWFTGILAHRNLETVFESDSRFHVRLNTCHNYNVYMNLFFRHFWHSSRALKTTFLLRFLARQ
jgi:hypothetical protein